MKSVKQHNSSLLYIPVLSLLLANPLNAASWTDTVSDYAQRAWKAMPTREQATQQINPLNWNMTPEQRQRLFYAGVAGTLGLGAGAVAYKYLYNTPTSEAQNEARASQLIQSFHDKRKIFNSIRTPSPADKINIFTQIWEIEDQLTQLLNFNRTSENFAENTLTTSLTYITSFLDSLISSLGITQHNAHILLNLNSLNIDRIKNQKLKDSLNHINDILYKKKNAVRYYRSMQSQLSYPSSKFNFQQLTSNIQNPELVLPEDRKILKPLYDTLQPNSSSSEQSSKTLDISAEYQTPEPSAPQHEADLSPSLAAAPVSMETPVQIPAPSNVPATEPSVTTQPLTTSPRREPIAPNPAQPTSPQAPTTTQKPRTIDDLKKIDVSQEDAALTIIKELSEFAPQNEEQEKQLKEVYNQKRKALQLFDELKKINHPNELQTFTEKLNNNKDLSDEDKETLKKEITQKIKSLTPSITKATSHFKKEAQEPDAPTEPSDLSAASTIEEQKDVESPSSIEHPVKNNIQEDLKLIKSAQSFKTLNNIKEEKFSSYSPEDQQQFATAFYTKYIELFDLLLLQPLSKIKRTDTHENIKASLAKLEQQYKDALLVINEAIRQKLNEAEVRELYVLETTFKDNLNSKNKFLPKQSPPKDQTPSLARATTPDKSAKQRAARTTVRVTLPKEIERAQSLHDLKPIKTAFNTYKADIDPTDISFFQTTYNKKRQELIAQQTEQPSQASAPSKITPQLTPTPSALPIAAASSSENPAGQKEPIKSKEVEKEPENTDQSSMQIITDPQFGDKEREKEPEETPMTIPSLSEDSNIEPLINLRDQANLPRAYITITNNTNETLRLSGSYVIGTNSDEQLKNVAIEPTDLAPQETMQLLEGDIQSINISYYNVGGWFTHYIAESQLAKDSQITIYTTTSNTYAYTIESAEQRKQLIDLGKEISDILRTDINPIPDSEINNPNIWNNPSLQDKLAQIKHKFGPDDTFAKQLMAKAFIVYLYSIAHALGHEFDEGTFVIHDDPKDLYNPAKRANASVILAFLANMPGVNRRGATHFNQLATLDPDKYAHLTSSLGAQNFYGLDLDLTKETQGDEQPKTTILFNRIKSTAPGNHINSKPSNISPQSFYASTPISIFIKPERFGTKNYGELALHALDLARTKSLKLIGSDIDDQPKYSKERVPVYLRKAFDNLIQTAVNNIDSLAFNNKEPWLQHMAIIALGNRDENKELVKNLKAGRVEKTNVEKILGELGLLLTNKKDQDAKRQQALDLKKYNTVDGWGIQQYLKLTDPDNPPSAKGEDAIVMFAPKEAQKFREMIYTKQNAPDLLTRAKYTHLDRRFGHEVSLDGKDLTTGESSQSGSASIQY